MEESNKYGYISVAYRSRFIFRTDAEYREAFGVSFETVVNKRYSERDMRVYYGILNRETTYEMDKSLDDSIVDYTQASKFYLTLDWGDRSQMASRKKFCRMLFRLYATAGKSLSNEEILKFNIKNDDRRLLETFFPDGVDKDPAVDIGLTVLFAFGIIRPWNGDNSRGRDIRDSETAKSLEKLRALVVCLKDDMPRLGSTEKPLVFCDWLNLIEKYQTGKESLSDISPLWLASSMLDISRACRNLVIAEQNRVFGEKFQGIYMYGIWIDDTDRGQTRFWIFPDNMLMALCYRRTGMAWELVPFEFRVRFADDYPYSNNFVLIEPEGDLNYILSPDLFIEDNQFGSGIIEHDFDEETNELTRITLCEDLSRFPGWLDWCSWERLSDDDPRYLEFRSALKAIYDPENPHSAIFTNTAVELTDSLNNLVGQDNKYLYIYDWQPARFMIKERSHARFTYEWEDGRDVTDEALFELDISEEHPLYAIPKFVEKKNYGNRTLDKLADILEDADNINIVSIVHSKRSRTPRIVFADYGVAFALDMDELKSIGVIKLTSRLSETAKPG